MIEKVIAIHGVPRSGTSWLGQIFNSHPEVLFKFQPLFSYALKNQIDEKSTTDEIKGFYQDMISNQSDLFLNLKDPNIHKNYPSFDKSKSLTSLVFKQVHHHYILNNLVRQDENIRFVFTIRNPLSIMASWKNAPKEFDPTWNFEEVWKKADLKNKGLRENYFGFDKWKEATNIFLHLKEQFPERVFLVNYASLIEDAHTEVTSLFHELGLGELPNQTNMFIKDSQSSNHSDPNSVFKNKVNDNKWKVHLPESVIQEIMVDDLFKQLDFKYDWINKGF